MAGHQQTPAPAAPVKTSLSGLQIWLIIFTILYNFVAFLFSTLWIFTNCFSGWKSGLAVLNDLQLNERVTYALFFSGMLGGSFYCLRAMYLRIAGNTQPENAGKKFLNIEAWIFWYLFRPWQSGVLALLILCLVDSGLMVNKSITADTLKSFYSLIAVGFLAGFGTHEVIGKVEELIAVLFAKSKAADKDKTNV